MSYDDYDQDAAEARFDDEMAQLERIAEFESFVKDMLYTIRLGSMSDLTDKRLLASWLNDFSKRASELGLLDGDAE